MENFDKAWHSNPSQQAERALSHWWQRQTPLQRQQLFQELQHQLRENGNNAAIEATPRRQLDPLPWLISEPEWLQLEQGIQQRQRLWNAILHDLYGEKLLLQHGIVPAELLFLAQSYVLPACQLLVPDQIRLPLLATDVGKDHAGRWVVIQEYSQLPEGLGYLLEHRLALNQCNPITPQIQKAQLAGFYRQLLKALGANSPKQGLVGLLAPPTRNADYFEQAFLANYLDIALVHGPDLMFKQQKLWLKTLTGLQPVQSLLRYIPDLQSDPLELEASSIGCAGLLQSLRQQQFVCMNTPGSALVDAQVLTPFLAQICQFLLAEPLLLQDASTFWLGSTRACLEMFSASCHYVLFDVRCGQHYLPSEMSDDELVTLKQIVELQPQAFIARLFQPLSQMPCWEPLQGEHQQVASLRLFSLQQATTSQVLPGAYARLASSAIQLQLSRQLQPNTLTSKDVWVLADRGQTSSLLHSSLQHISLSRQNGLVPSRVADQLFWLGRYNERLNLICRALRCAIPLLSQPTPEQQQAASALLRFCMQANGGKFASCEPILLPQVFAQMFDPQNPLGLVAVLRNLLYNAQSVREYFSEDTWHVLDKLQTAILEWPQQFSLSQNSVLLRQLDDIILLQTAIYGLNNETMSRTQALAMMDLGLHLERALQTSALLQTVFVPPIHAEQASATLMEAVLRMADTLLTYRRRYRSALHPLAIIDLLLLDLTTPRSVGFQCQRLQQQCAQLPVLEPSTTLSAEARLTLELVSLLQLVDPDSLFDETRQATPALGMLFNQLQHRLRQLSDSITLSYFNHAKPQSAWQSF